MSDLRDRLGLPFHDRAELFEIADEIEELIGSRELIDNMLKYLDIDTLQDMLEYIARNFDL